MQKEITISKEIKLKWQKHLNTLAVKFDIPYVVLSVLEGEDVYVFLSHDKSKRFFAEGKKVDKLAMPYCYKVVENERRHYEEIPDNLGVKTDGLQISHYLGFPVKWPNGQIFGIFCLIDIRINESLRRYSEVIEEFKSIFEHDLFNLVESLIRMENEKEIRVSQERFEVLFDNIPEAIFIADMKGNFIDGNRAAEKLVGIRLKELVGKNLLKTNLLGKFESKKALALLRSTLAGNAGKPVIFHYQKSDNTSAILEVKTHIITISGKKRIMGVVNDITTQKSLEKELRDSAEKYHDLFENAPDMYMIRDSVSEKIRECNRAFHETLGYKKEEIIGKSLKFIYHPDSYEDIREAYNNFRKKGNITNKQFQLLTKDNRTIDVIVNSVALKDDEDRVVTSRSVFRDITELVKAEKAVRESELRYRNFIKHSLDGVYHFDLDEPMPLDIPFDEQVEWVKKKTTLVECNDVFAKMYGFEGSKEALGISIEELFSDEEEFVNKLISDWIEMGYKFPNYESYEPTQGGGFKWFENSGFGMIENDKLTVIWGTQADITERKIIEEEIQKHRDHLEQLVAERTEELKISNEEVRKLSMAVEQSPATVVITDVEGNIEYVNPTFTEVTGYTQLEAIGQNPRILKTEDTPNSYYKEMWDIISKGKVWKGEFKNKKKDGTIFWESCWISPLKDENDKITHYVAVKQDVTSRKNLEYDLVNAKEQAEAASKAKSEFLTSMSHEIRTPLNAISGFTYLAQETDQIEKIKEYLAKIDHSTNHLMVLINDILDFSNIEKGAVELEETSFLLNDLLGQLSDIVTVMASEKNLDYINENKTGKFIELFADQNRLKQVLFNLLSNAVKFTEEGNVTLVTELLGKSEKLVELRFTVNDTGIGIDKLKQKELFKPFKQVDSTTTREYSGAGLGLVISKNVVEAMGGEIGFKSKVGKGSSFYVTARFKYAAISDSHIEPTKGETSDATKDKLSITGKSVIDTENINILLVEDNSINQELIRNLLEKQNINVTITSNGKEAVEYLQSLESETAIDLILMDLHMPVMDGYEASIKIKTMPRFKDVPVVALTADVISGVKEKCQQAGMVDYISKPMNPGRFIKILSRWITVNYDAETVSNVNESFGISDFNADLLDTQDGIRRLGNNEELYVRLLVDFQNQFKDFKTKISDLLVNKEWQQLQHELHTLKGVSGNLGAKELHNVCKFYETQLKEGAESVNSDSLLEDLDSKLLPLLKAINNWNEKESKSKSVEKEVPVTEELMEKLKVELHNLLDMLKESNTFALSSMKEIISLIQNTKFDEQFAGLDNAVRMYDFDNAILEVENLLKDIDQ